MNNSIAYYSSRYVRKAILPKKDRFWTIWAKVPLIGHSESGIGKTCYAYEL